MQIVAAGPFHHDLGRQGADAQIVFRRQPLARGGFETVGVGRRLGRQGLGQGLAHLVQFGEVVAARLDIFANPFGRAGVHQAFAVLGGGAGPGAAVVKGLVQAQHGVRDAGRLFQQLHQFVTGQGQAREQRVGQNLAQPCLVRRPALVQAAQIDVIGLSQSQQQLGRNGPLIAFYVVEIAGRNAQVGRHGRLSQSQVAPQPLQPGAEEKLAIGGDFHGRRMSHYD